MAEKCDWCGRFGGRKYVIDKGPNGRGGHTTYTYYECAACTRKIETDNFNNGRLTTDRRPEDRSHR